MSDIELPKITIGDRITLPTAFGQLFVQHLRSDIQEGIIVTGQKPFADPLPVRIQSSCLFSESLLSTDCDCAAQLHGALGIISSSGGLLVYLYEEGRGAGLELKIKAIKAEQDMGYHTADAYGHLELDPDPRTNMVAAAAVLSIVGPNHRVEVLTNNLNKVNALRDVGVNVVHRRPFVYKRNSSVEQYLLQKSNVLGHRLDHD